ncbi:MAG: type II toxin-antitoxin system Phd/YefM family antitoxin [Magnetospirillum sp. WYHS-4]
MAEVSIAEAKNHLPRLVQRAEAGEPVRITRRGRRVAVLLSEREFERLNAPREGLGVFLGRWRAEMAVRGIEFPAGPELEGLRDNGGRPAPDLA